MITGTIINPNIFDDIRADLQRFKGIDLHPLAQRIARIVEEDTVAGILAGIGGDGRALAPLKASTLKHRDGSGPPGAPTASSSIVRGFRVDVTIDGQDLTIDTGWQGEAAQHARFLVEGNRNQVPREIRGLRPESVNKIQNALDDFARSVAAGNF